MDFIDVVNQKVEWIYFFPYGYNKWNTTYWSLSFWSTRSWWTCTDNASNK